MPKHRCMCCGNYTLPAPQNEAIAYICPVCFWENDPIQLSKPDMRGGANRMCLNEARIAYSKGKKVL